MEWRPEETPDGSLVEVDTVTICGHCGGSVAAHDSRVYVPLGNLVFHEPCRRASQEVQVSWTERRLAFAALCHVCGHATKPRENVVCENGTKRVRHAECHQKVANGAR